MSAEDKKYKKLLPPLSLLSEVNQNELISELKKLDFFPDRNRAG